jgi:glycosyltransferase involved in cell wall biosynthesis
VRRSTQEANVTTAHSNRRIAIIVPCFNDGATLREALASIDEPEPVEVVVVDDGSDDRQTLEVLGRLEAEGIRVIHQANEGLSSARMAGTHATTARYVTSLDADDLRAPGALAKLADALDRNRAAVAAWGDVQNFGEKQILDRPGGDIDPWLLTYINTLPSSALFRRDALLAAGGWTLRGGYEDWELWLALAERGWTGVYLPILSGYYRVRATRMLADAETRHRALIGEIARRHPILFQQRGRNWLRSSSPWRCKLLLPLIAHLPVSARLRHRLSRFVFRPTASARVRLGRAVGGYRAPR